MRVPETAYSMDYCVAIWWQKAINSWSFNGLWQLSTNVGCAIFHPIPMSSSVLLLEYRCHLASFNQYLSFSRLVSSCTDPV
jgi:hypothetical protein